VARDLDIYPDVMQRLKQEDIEDLFPDKGRMKPVEAEPPRLKKRLTDVTEKSDTFKKASMIFSKNVEGYDYDTE